MRYSKLNARPKRYRKNKEKLSLAVVDASALKHLKKGYLIDGYLVVDVSSVDQVLLNHISSDFDVFFKKTLKVTVKEVPGTPIKKELVVVNRSPFGHNKSKEHFETRTYRKNWQVPFSCEAELEHNLKTLFTRLGLKDYKQSKPFTVSWTVRGKL